MIWDVWLKCSLWAVYDHFLENYLMLQYTSTDASEWIEHLCMRIQHQTERPVFSCEQHSKRFITGLKRQES